MNAKRSAASLSKTETKSEKRKANNKWFFFVIGFSLFAFSFRSEAKSNAAIRAFNAGVKAFNARQFGEAIPSFDEAISEDPEFTEAYFARGACKYYLKSLDAAVMDLNETLRLKPDYLNARALRGAVNYETDHWTEALDDFNVVLAQNPNDAQSLLGRAVILLKREDFSGAARDFKGFLRIRPDDPLAPKVRQLLASLKRVPTPEKSPEEEQAAPRAPRETPRAAAARPSMKGREMTSAELQRLADSLLAHPLSDSYERKILRGEKAQAVGDIHSIPGVPTERRSPDEAPQIVDPQ